MRPKKNKPCAVLVRPRIYIGDGIALGPGKIDLLHAVGEMRSIAAAARSLGVPYKRAWLLIDSLNVEFGRQVVETATGGKDGGGASLTTLGQQLFERYDTLETSLNASAGKELQALRDLANCPLLDFGYGVAWMLLYAARYVYV